MSDLLTGWSAAEVHPSELVDDEWIAANTAPMRAPSRVRHAVSRVGKSLRTFGIDPSVNSLGDGSLAMDGPTGRVVGSRFGLQAGGFTRDQMRRIVARTGVPGIEAWSARNYGPMRAVWGALCHHTGTSWLAPGDYPTLRVVRDGRPGLENSLSMFGLGRYSYIYLISEKLSWHAGVGAYNGLTDGNGYLGGIEAESDGLPGHWTAFQVKAYPRLVASILIEIHDTDRYTTRHATWALPPGRKNDFAGWPGGPETFWAQVYWLLANPAYININYNPGGEIMAKLDPDDYANIAKAVWNYRLGETNGGTAENPVSVPDESARDRVNAIRRAGVSVRDWVAELLKIPPAG